MKKEQALVKIKEMEDKLEELKDCVEDLDKSEERPLVRVYIKDGQRPSNFNSLGYMDYLLGTVVEPVFTTGEYIKILRKGSKYITWSVNIRDVVFVEGTFGDLPTYSEWLEERKV